jgi:dipeptidyl aminopeptidase/acylaminoacyl peptidase
MDFNEYPFMHANRTMIALALLGAGACMAGTAAAAAADASQPFSVQDLVRLERLSELAASPDGNRVVYTLRTTDMQANKGRTALWLLNAGKRGAAPLRLTDDSGNARSAEWSADGKFVYFLADHAGSAQVWRVTPTGEGAMQVTHLPLDVGSFRVSPKGDRLLVSVEVFRDCADLDCTKKRLDAAAAALAAGGASGVLHDRIFMRHWDAWSDGRRSQLFALDLDGMGIAGGTPVTMTAGIDGDVPGKPDGGREDYGFSPDGAQVVYSVRVAANGEPWSTNFDIYAVASGGGTPRNLTADNPAWDGQPAFSPDGTQLAYVATDRPGFESDRFHLVLMNVKTGVKRPLTQRWDRSISSFAWARDGKTLFATTDHLGQHPVWSIDADTGRTAAITGAGQVDSFSIGAQKVYYTQNDLADPANLFSVAFNGGKPAQLTHLNQALMSQRRLGEFQQFSFTGWNGENVFAYVIKPVDFNPAKKYPVALLIHGGPQGSMANEWHYRWNPQNYAGAGYAAVMIDFHGSTGYGQAFTDSISGDWGGKPLEDLKRGVDAALKLFPWLDGGNMCALGGSYGGYMVNWIAGVWPDRFKCVVTHDGVFDLRSMYYSTEELWFPEWEFGGPEYQNPAGFAKQNPVDHVKNWQTPMLVIHGRLDFRLPDTQGISVFTALQRRGIPSEFLYFPEENHFVLKPADSIQWYDTVIAWMNRWTKP